MGVGVVDGFIVDKDHTMEGTVIGFSERNSHGRGCCLVFRNDMKLCNIPIFYLRCVCQHRNWACDGAWRQN